MTHTTLKAVHIPVFELFAPDGRTLGLFRVKSEWKGMRELERLEDKCVIIVDGTPPADNLFAHVFGDIFGTKAGEGLTLLKASPQLLSELIPPKAEKTS